MSRSKPKSKSKGRTPLALKATGGGPNQETTLPMATNKEMTETVKNTDESKTSTLNERQQSAAVEAQAEGSPVEVTGDAVVQALKRPYTPSYFFPGKLEGKPVLFLVDTGCTTNLLSKHVFVWLPEWVKYGLADVIQLSFYGVLRLPL